MISRNFILVSVGTDGDIIPYVALGARLRERGHRVTLVTNEPFRQSARSHGFDFHPLVTSEEDQELLENPDFWHPLKGAGIAARWGARLIDRQYYLLADLAVGPSCALVASPGVVAARMVQEKHGTPLATVVLQPGMLPSITRPPRMPGFTLPAGLPLPLGWLYWRAVNAVGNRLIGRDLNQLRRQLGLAPVTRIFEWWYSPRLILGMFPAWYAQPQPDWPKQLRLVGFPMYDGQKAPSLPPETLQFCESGDPPVVFTFGTGMMHASVRFDAAVEACRILGRRAIFLTKFREQLVNPLPAFVHHSAFAPFRLLFPRCAAVVHHGGVGTVAKALAAGVPQIIVPFAFDQFDNASRIKSLGVGRWLSGREASALGIASALKYVLTQEHTERCRRLAALTKDTPDALQLAAEEVESLRC